jgi:hypothetical protein
MAMELPLFPLHTVLCPGIVLPLHIFEERYQLLTRRCLDTQSPFGVVLIRDGGEVGEGPLTLAGVGTFARIREATELPDGRFDLLAVGEGRFRVAEVTVGREPYLIAKVTPIEDDVADPALAAELAGQVSRRFIRYLELLQPADGEEADEIEVQMEIDAPADPSEPGEPAYADAGAEDDPRAAELEDAAQRLTVPNDPTALSYLLAGIIQIEHVRRQTLLEAETTDVRLYELARLLDREIELLSLRLRNFAPDVTILPQRRN